jgi:hypothetical protein
MSEMHLMVTLYYMDVGAMVWEFKIKSNHIVFALLCLLLYKDIHTKTVLEKIFNIIKTRFYFKENCQLYSALHNREGSNKQTWGKKIWLQTLNFNLKCNHQWHNSQVTK